VAIDESDWQRRVDEAWALADELSEDGLALGIRRGILIWRCRCTGARSNAGWTVIGDGRR